MWALIFDGVVLVVNFENGDAAIVDFERPALPVWDVANLSHSYKLHVVGWGALLGVVVFCGNPCLALLTLYCFFFNFHVYGADRVRLDCRISVGLFERVFIAEAARRKVTRLGIKKQFPLPA